jgi:hypothetical protein
MLLNLASSCGGSGAANVFLHMAEDARRTKGIKTNKIFFKQTSPFLDKNHLLPAAT